ncbi:uncharacterized protein A1O9_08917 [Exophiala aquamarina CBS 119918]|uniref:PH domain-containing protein n=1 Tax=Exophiala aquamarina CBS 119918 TaxID=1182545 RepID=A0A072P7P1_9EURO|nr:uncharacterized protein A1O9_08917 [Exophiala aquamarina CBS 119918]KEF55263.1 hypothetical protein A1O9_08917 [Exophiala aquamarina CBS 119918]
MSSSAYARNEQSLLVEEQSGWWPSERTAKARLRAFFSRTKSDNKIPKYHTTPDHDQADTQPMLASIACSSGKNGSTTRDRSTTWSARHLRPSQRGLKQTRPRTLALDPPPLIQAYTQAKLHDILDVPSSLTDVLVRNTRGRRNSISGESPTRCNLETSFSSTLDIQDSGKHRRNWSGASSFTKKVFVLSSSGYVLQYSAEGLNDRIPEQILELGSRSVAFASDAVPGKHWVLRISQDHTGGRTTSHAPKSSWSKLSFRHNENKRLVQDLLLVFDSALTLGIWLTAIRREIELMGGLEYRPDSRDDEAKHQSRPVLKAQKSLPNIPRASLFFPAESLPKYSQPSSPKPLPPMPQWAPTIRNVSTSTTDSSIHTLNELDDLRDSSFSDDQSTYTATTSVAGSVASRSPAFESFFANDMSYREPLTPASTASRLSTPTQADIGELSMYMETPRKSGNAESLVPERLRRHGRPDAAQCPNTPAGGKGVVDHALFVQPSPYSTMQTRPISTIAPLPAPGHLRKSSRRQKHESQPVYAQPNTPASSRPSSIRSRSSSNVTLGSPTDAHFNKTASYSLFPPRRDSSVGFGSVAAAANVSLPLNIRPATGVEESNSPASTRGSSVDFGDDGRSSTSEDTALHLRERSMSTARSKGLLLNTNSADVASGAQRVSQRSPIVTERHLQTCFGTAPNQNGPKRARAPSQAAAESCIETTLLEMPALISKTPSKVRLSNPPRRQKHLKGQKSMPTLACGTMPPSGPPPTGPLPDLPCEAFSPGKKRSPKANSTGSTSTSAYSSTVSLQSRHAHAESSPSSLSTTKIASRSLASPTAAPLDNNTHAKTSSVSSVDSVRDVTAWLSSPRIAAFTAKYGTNTAPKLDVALPDTSSFSSSFSELMP